MRARGAHLQGAAVPAGCPLPADTARASLRLPPGAVGALLPLQGVAPGGRQRQLCGRALSTRGLLPSCASRPLLPLRVRSGLGRAALRDRGGSGRARGRRGAAVPTSRLPGQARGPALRPRVQQPGLRLGRRRLLAERGRPLAAVRGAAVLAPLQQQPLRSGLQLARLPLRQLRLPRPRAHLQVSREPHQTPLGPARLRPSGPVFCLSLGRPSFLRHLHVHVQPLLEGPHAHPVCILSTCPGVCSTICLCTPPVHPYARTIFSFSSFLPFPSLLRICRRPDIRSTL